MLTLKPTTEDATDVMPFDFEGASVRVARKGEHPWFVLADVCQALEIANSRNVAARLDDEDKGVQIVDTPSGAQQMTVVNESGVYALIMTSRKPSAKRFKRWVTSEVLPAIRRTGGYMIARPDETPEELMLRALKVAQDTVERQKAQIANMAPKVEALDRIASADGSLAITDAAKALQMRPSDLFAYLDQNGWTYRRPGGSHRLGYQSKTTAGFLEHKITTILRADGSEKVTEQVRITPLGLSKLAQLIKPLTLV